MVLSWIDHHREALTLTVRQCTDLTSLIPGIFDFRVSLQIAGLECHGAGTGPSREQALEIAATEACERAILRTHGANVTFLGSAADTNPSIARERAVREWSERRSFQYHFHYGMPGHIWTDDDKRAICSRTSNILIERINSAGDRLTVMDLVSPQGACIVLAFVEFSNRRQERAVVMGLGSKSSRSSSLDHALIELIRNYLAATKLEGLPTANKHDAVITDARQRAIFSKLAEPTPPTRGRPLDWQSPTIMTIDKSSSIFASSPLVVVGAKA